jgi:TonB family protein
MLRSLLLTTTRPVLLLGILLCAARGFTQSQSELSADLVRHTFILRNFYTNQRLNFDSSGALISDGTPGFGPTDGRVYIKEVQLAANHLTLRGERPVSIFDPGTGDTTLLGLHRKVEIDVQLLPDKPSNDNARALLDKIFLTSSESDALTCSEEEAKAFRLQMLQSKEFVSVKKDGAAKKVTEPRQLCFPGGTRAYVVEGGVGAPKAVKTPDPPYPNDGSVRGENKTVVLAMVVDVAGKPSSMVVIGPGASVFDIVAVDAVQHWKFLPATYQGKPVPAAINVEVNFRPR